MFLNEKKKNQRQSRYLWEIKKMTKELNLLNCPKSPRNNRKLEGLEPKTLRSLFMNEKSLFLAYMIILLHYFQFLFAYWFIVYHKKRQDVLYKVWSHFTTYLLSNFYWTAQDKRWSNKYPTKLPELKLYL